MGTVYLDSSALVKFILDEQGSAGMRSWLVGVRAVTSSRLVAVESVRAVRRADKGALSQLEAALRSINLLPVSDRRLDLAAAIEPAQVRSLDAIHIATALSLGPDLDSFVSYDQKQAESARRYGLNVVTP